MLIIILYVILGLIGYALIGAILVGLDVRFGFPYSFEYDFTDHHPINQLFHTGIFGLGCECGGGNKSKPVIAALWPLLIITSILVLAVKKIDNIFSFILNGFSTKQLK